MLNLGLYIVALDRPKKGGGRISTDRIFVRVIWIQEQSEETADQEK